MNFVFHPFAQCSVDELMTGNQSLAGELRAHNNRFKVSAVAGHIKVFAGQPGGNVIPNIFWGG
jgi:hypothetical protein